MAAPGPRAGSCVAILCGTILSLSPRPVAAQEEPAPRSAEDHYELGTKLYAQGRYIDAAREYVQAFDAVGAPELAYNAARAFDRGGRWQDAQAYYDRWLAGVPPLADREGLAVKLRQAGDQAAAAGQLDLGIKRLTYAMRLRVTPDPNLTFTLAALYERAGRGTLAQEMYRRALTDGYSNTDELEAALRRVGRAATVGRVVLLGEARDIQVRVDGRLVQGADAGSEFQVTAGQHQIEVVKDGHQTWRGRAVVRAGQLTTVPFMLQRSPPPGPRARRVEPPPRPAAAGRSGSSAVPPTKSLVAYGVSGAGVVAGLVFGSLAKGNENQLEDCRRDYACATDRDSAETLSDRAASRSLQANLSFGVAVIAAGAATWLWVSGRSEPRDDLDDELGAAVRWGPLGVAWRF